jgi:hypothetical protein
MHTKTFLMVVLAIGLAAFGMLANAQPPPQFHTKGGPPEMLQIVLALTDEQTTVVNEIVADNRKKMAEILENSSLTRQDLGLLHGITNKFTQTGTENLAAIFNKQQLQILHREVSNKSPLGYIVLSAREKLNLLKNALPMDKEQTHLVTTLIAHETTKQGIVLENLDLNPEEILAFHEAMDTQREEMLEKLSTVLSEKQLELFMRIKDQMGPKRLGHRPPPEHRGARL